MNITINLITNLQETVPNTVLTKILTVKRNGGVVNLTGNIYIPAAYVSEVLEFCTYFGLTEDENTPGTYRGNDIILSVGTSYISFEDNEVARIINGTFGSDGHTTVLLARNAVFTSSTFKDNTVILTFPEFDLFTRANSNPPLNLFYGCTNLVSIDLSNVTEISLSEFRKSGLTGDISIPNLLTMSAGGYNFEDTNISSVSNLGTITSIPIYAFEKCKNLTSVAIPSTVTNIGLMAFSAYNLSYAKVLTTITGLENVTSYGLSVFINLLNLNLDITNLNKVESTGHRLFLYCKKVTGIVNFPKLISMGGSDGSEFENTAITKVQCLGKVNKIPRSCFFQAVNSDNSTKLKEVYIPYECVNIDGAAFLNCVGLTTIKQYTDSVDDWVEGETPTYTDISRVTTFGEECFRNCSLLQLSASALTNATSIGKNAFSNCRLLTGELNLPNLISLGDSAFLNCTSITSADLTGSAIISIPNSCFSECTSLTSFTDFSNIASIGGGAFYNTKITGDLSIPNLTGTLGNSVFRNTNITSISDLGSITGISPDARFGYAEGAFNDCKILTTVTLPSTLTSISSGFSGCISLTTVNGNLLNLTSLNNSAFSSTKISSIPNMAGLLTIGRDVFFECSLLSVAVNCPNLTSLGNRAFGSSGITSIVNLGSVTSIPRECFYNCTSLTSINLSNIKTVDWYVFLFSGITSINLPAIETISERGLSCCSNCSIIDLGPNLSSIGNLAFWDSAYTTFIFRGTTVPTFNKNSSNKFLYNMSNVTIYVPESALNDYKTAWPQMASNMVKIEGSAYDTQS